MVHSLDINPITTDSIKHLRKKNYIDNIQSKVHCEHPKEIELLDLSFTCKTPIVVRGATTENGSCQHTLSKMWQRLFFFLKA